MNDVGRRARLVGSGGRTSGKPPAADRSAKIPPADETVPPGSDPGKRLPAWIDQAMPTRVGDHDGAGDECVSGQLRSRDQLLQRLVIGHRHLKTEVTGNTFHPGASDPTTHSIRGLEDSEVKIRGSEGSGAGETGGTGSDDQDGMVGHEIGLQSEGEGQSDPRIIA